MKKIIFLVLCGLLLNQGLLFSQEKGRTESGWESYNAGLYEKALEEFLKLKEDSPAALRGIGYVYNKLGRYDEAEDVLKKVLETDERFEEIKEYVQFPGSVEKFPITSDAQSTLAWNYYYKKDYKNAVETFKDVLKRHSDWVDPYDGLGWAYIADGSYDKAYETFRKELKTEKGTFDAHKGLGYTEMKRFKFDSAVKHLNKTLESAPDDVNININLGWSYYNKKKYNRAQDLFEKAVSLNPYLFEPHKGLALSLYHLNKYEEAKAEFLKAAGIFPGYVDDAELQKIIEERENWFNLYNVAGWTYYNMGFYAKANSAFGKVLKKNPYNDEALKGRGFSSFYLAEYDEAVSNLNKLLEDIPETEKNWGMWSGILSALGWSNYYIEDYASAIDIFNELAELHSEGAWAEVVSGFEYDIALSLKVPAKHIVFNGHYKPFEQLERAVKGNSIINVDSFSELNQFIELAAKGRRKIKAGLRLNMNLNYPPWDKFGFNLESGQALEACARAHSSGKIVISGLHIHAGTYLTDYTIYNRAVRNLIDFALHIEKKFGFKIEYLDLGGGYASHNTLLGQFLTASQTIPTYRQYADAICLPLIKAKDKFKNPPRRLILEPGRVLVDEAVYLITTVVSTKKLRERINAAIIDAGVNILPTAYWYKHGIEPARSGEAAFEEVNIYGPLCMQIDVIRTGVRLPPLKFGDMLVIKNVGAYNISQSMQFIHQRPAVVLPIT